MKIRSIPSLLLLAILLPVLFGSCSHKYDPDTLDLEFYQWNLWYDNATDSDRALPSCGWEDLHRGMGKLVRIPAMAADHFPEQQAAGALWYHCRFTLPENWEERKISLEIKGAAPEAALFLNQEMIASLQGNTSSFEMDCCLNARILLRSLMICIKSLACMLFSSFTDKLQLTGQTQIG